MWELTVQLPWAAWSVDIPCQQFSATNSGCTHISRYHTEAHSLPYTKLFTGILCAFGGVFEERMRVSAWPVRLLYGFVLHFQRMSVRCNVAALILPCPDVRWKCFGKKKIGTVTYNECVPLWLHWLKLLQRAHERAYYLMHMCKYNYIIDTSFSCCVVASPRCCWLVHTSSPVCWLIQYCRAYLASCCMWVNQGTIPLTAYDGALGDTQQYYVYIKDCTWGVLLNK